jgi:DNA-binding NarL/FixJ family response regulator
MTDGLDLIIVDDDESVCKLISATVRKFYTWGKIHEFTNVDDAIAFCLIREVGIAIFIVDVFLGSKSGFSFLDAIEARYPKAHEDAIVITGNANEDIVNMCLAADVNYLLEKPIKPYALQLAVRAIAGKYLDFARNLMDDPGFAATVARL